MRILYISTSQNGLPGLKRLCADGFEIVSVYSLTPNAGAKYEVPGYVDMNRVCNRYGIPVILSNDYLVRANLLPDFDVLVVNGWSRLIPEDIYIRASIGAVGVHAGHPPTGLGRAPIVWNILLGHSDLEVYVFKLTPTADNGAILGRRTVQISAYDNAQLLYEKVAFAAGELLPSAIKALSSGTEGQAQELEFAKPYPKRVASDSLADFSLSAENLCRFVRAQSAPYPTAFAFVNDLRYELRTVIPFDSHSFRDVPRVPGEVLALLPSGPVVMSGTSAVWIVDGGFEGGGELEIGDRFRLGTGSR